MSYRSRRCASSSRCPGPEARASASTIGSRISAPSPPTSDDEPWVADYQSSNGATARAQAQRAQRLVALGYITAAAMPPVGLIIAIVIAVRPTKAYSRHWRWIVLVSIVATAIWLGIIASGALTATDNGY